MSDGDGKKKLSGAQNRKRKLEKELCLKKNTSSIEKFILRPGPSSEEHRNQDSSTLPPPSSPPLPLVVQESEEPPCGEVFLDNTIIREDVLNDLALWPQVLSGRGHF